MTTAYRWYVIYADGEAVAIRHGATSRDAEVNELIASGFSIASHSQPFRNFTDAEDHMELWNDRARLDRLHDGDGQMDLIAYLEEVWQLR